MSAPRTVVKKGERFGSLRVINWFSGPDGRTWVKCKCHCGKKTEVRAWQLKKGQVKSCGCGRGKRVTAYGGLSSHITYNSWAAMIRRCTDPKHPHYERYGGRGITFHPPWKDYLIFLMDVGKRPSIRHSLDRVDNEGNYVPGNVRWATATEQALNRGTKL